MRKQTPGCREVVSLTGDLEPFAEAAERLLVKLTGLNVSASTVRRVTESVGNDVAARRAAGETLGPVTPWDWEQDAEGKRVAYVGLDATSVPQQGAGGKKAEGRMQGHRQDPLDEVAYDWSSLGRQVFFQGR